MTPTGQMMDSCGLLFRNHPASAVLLTVTCCLAVALTFFGVHRRASRGAGEFTVSMAAVGIWSIGYFFELVLPSASGRMLAAQIEYLGIASLPPLWLLLAARYTDGIDLRRPLRAALLFVVPAVTLGMAATSRSHGLLWSRVWMDLSISPPLLRFVHGPYFWVNLLYAYLLLLAGTVLFIWSIVASRPFRRSVSVAMIIAAVAPWIGNVLYISGLNPSPGFDSTPFCFAVSGCALAWVLFRHSLLDMVPFARNRVVETMVDPVFVTDSRGRVVDANPAAAALVPTAGTLVGAPLSTALPGLARRDRERGREGGPARLTSSWREPGNRGPSPPTCRRSVTASSA